MGFERAIQNHFSTATPFIRATTHCFSCTNKSRTLPFWTLSGRGQARRSQPHSTEKFPGAYVAEVRKNRSVDSPLGFYQTRVGGLIRMANSLWRVCRTSTALRGSGDRSGGEWVSQGRAFSAVDGCVRDNGCFSPYCGWGGWYRQVVSSGFLVRTTGGFPTEKDSWQRSESAHMHWQAPFVQTNNATPSLCFRQPVGDGHDAKGRTCNGSRILQG